MRESRCQQRARDTRFGNVRPILIHPAQTQDGILPEAPDTAAKENDGQHQFLRRREAVSHHRPEPTTTITRRVERTQTRIAIVHSHAQIVAFEVSPIAVDVPLVNAPILCSSPSKCTNSNRKQEGAQETRRRSSLNFCFEKG